MALKQKEKAAMMNRLVSIFNDTGSHRDACLAAIAICMLDKTPTDEDITHYHSMRKKQFSMQDDSVHASEQKKEDVIY